MCQLIDAHAIDVAVIVLTSSCLLISVGSFAFVLIMVRTSSDAVHRREAVRSAAYMVKTAVIVLPSMVLAFIPSTVGLQPTVIDFGMIANTLQDLNGAANAA